MGHFGVEKTLELLCCKYFWDGMASDVKDFISTCPARQTSKATTTKPPALLHSLPVPAAKFTDIGIDFVGLLPTSQGFDYLIVIWQTYWMGHPHSYSHDTYFFSFLTIVLWPLGVQVWYTNIYSLGQG